MTDFAKDERAHQAFYELRDSIADEAALRAPDFSAAADPESGRPFELWIDASEYAWVCFGSIALDLPRCTGEASHPPRPIGRLGRAIRRPRKLSGY